MKFFVALLLIALLAFTAGLYLPWYSVALAGFLVALGLDLRPAVAFFSGFVSVFLLWILLYLKIDADNGGILAPKMAHILPLGGSVALLMLAGAFIGGVSGGLGALTGSMLRRLADPAPGRP